MAESWQVGWQCLEDEGVLSKGSTDRIDTCVKNILLEAAKLNDLNRKMSELVSQLSPEELAQLKSEGIL